MIAFKKWTGLFKGKSDDAYQMVQVRAPREYFKRADVFIDDVKHMTKEELPGLNKAVLVKLLFDNFLEKVRDGEDLYGYIDSLHKTYSSVLTTSPDIVIKDVRRANEAPKFSWKLPHNSKRDHQESLILSVKLLTSEITRVEVFFEDLRWTHHHPVDMEIDELVSLLFIEFITALRSGLAEETREDIIQFILSRWEESA